MADRRMMNLHNLFNKLKALCKATPLHLLIRLLVLIVCIAGFSPLDKGMAKDNISETILSEKSTQAIWFLDRGVLHRYLLAEQKLEQMDFTKDKIGSAQMSTKGQRLVYATEGAIQVIDKPFITKGASFLIIGEIYENYFLISPNQSWLAYSDDTGLQLGNLTNGRSWMLLKNQLDYKDDVSDFRFYNPLTWSPDGKWLWINERWWEGRRTLIYSLSDLSFQRYACIGDIDWFSNSKAFISAIYYSGYEQCGLYNGIFLHNGSQISTHSRLYYDREAQQPWDRDYSYPRIDPTQKWILFIQDAYPGSDLASATLKVIRLNGTVVMELPQVVGNIFSPVWSLDGEHVYYVEHEDKTDKSILYKVSIPGAKKHIYYSSARRLEIKSLSPDGKWLAFTSEKPGSPNRYDLNLLNLETGNVILKIVEQEEGEFNQLFVGWE